LHWIQGQRQDVVGYARDLAAQNVPFWAARSATEQAGRMSEYSALCE
jgi:hypothetical protein